MSIKRGGVTVSNMQLCVLPEIVVSRGKASFDPRLDVWSYRESTQNISLNFKLLGVEKNFLSAMKAVLIWYVENRSGTYTKNLFERMLHLLKFLGKDGAAPVRRISIIDILNYKESLSPEIQWYLRTVGIFLRKWLELGYSGIEAEIAKLFGDLRLPANAKGIAVLTMDPVRGPYSDLEVEAIQAALNAAYANDAISKRHYVLVWLFMLLGQRPTQYANLRLCDLSMCVTEEGGSTYLLQVPRAKQRDRYSRSSFTPRALLPQFGFLLQSYVDEVRTQFAGKLKDPEQAPMFPKRGSSKAPQGYEYHPTAGDIGAELTIVLKQLKVSSERTGTLLHITATRFRRTIGTRAAAEGHGELVIAELLDHSDTSNAGVYVQATPAIVERIDRAIAMQLAPLAQAFAGVLIRDESEAERGNDPRSRIVDPRLGQGTQPMGNCGKHGFCGFAAPIACYTCTNFQPWLDGPHEAVLTRLIEERDRLSRDTDARIAAINDRTILAVAEVVRRCEAAHTLSVGGAHG